MKFLNSKRVRKCKRFAQERLDSQGFWNIMVFALEIKALMSKTSKNLKQQCLSEHSSDVHLGIRVAIQEDAIEG